MAATKQASRKPRRKDRKSVPVGQAHIKSTFNNTIISITDPSGAVVSWASGGDVGFKGSQRVWLQKQQPVRHRNMASRRLTFSLRDRVQAVKPRSVPCSLQVWRSVPLLTEHLRHSMAFALRSVAASEALRRRNTIQPALIGTCTANLAERI